MRILSIFDNGGKTLDRYTVVTDQHDGNYLMMLGLNEGGDGFSQWSGGSYAEGRGEKNQHLGKRVQFEALSAATQKHIAERIFSDD